MDDWVVDGLIQFVQSPLWKSSVENFIDDHCLFFDAEDEMRLSYTEIHRTFQEMIDALLTSFVVELGVTSEQAIAAVRRRGRRERGPRTPLQKLLVFLNGLDDFVSFKKMMEKRNIELEYEAMQTLAQRGRAPSKAALIMKEAEMEDAELQMALRESLLMEQQRQAEVAAQKSAATAQESVNSSQQAIAEAVARERATEENTPEGQAALQRENERLAKLNEEFLEQRRRLAVEAQQKVAALKQEEGTAHEKAPVPAPVAEQAAQPPVISQDLNKAPSVSQTTPAPTAPAPAAPAPAEPAPVSAAPAPAAPAPAQPSVVHIRKTSGAADVAALPDVGQKRGSFAPRKALPGIQPTFSQLVGQTSTPVVESPTKASLPRAGDLDQKEFERRQEEMRKQRDLIIAARKEKRQAEASAVTPTPTAPESATKEMSVDKRKQAAADLARRLKEDIMNEARRTQ